MTEAIASVVGYNGAIVWDTSKPNGTMRKVMDVSRVNDLGWKASTDLRKVLSWRISGLKIMLSFNSLGNLDVWVINVPVCFMKGIATDRGLEVTIPPLDSSEKQTLMLQTLMLQFTNHSRLVVSAGLQTKKSI